MLNRHSTSAFNGSGSTTRVLCVSGTLLCLSAPVSVHLVMLWYFVEQAQNVPMWRIAKMVCRLRLVPFFVAAARKFAVLRNPQKRRARAAPGAWNQAERKPVLLWMMATKPRARTWRRHRLRRKRSQSFPSAWLSICRLPYS